MADETRGAGEWNVIIKQGETWLRTITVRDDDGVVVDLSAYSIARMFVRKQKDSGSTLLELTDASEIDLSGLATGVITITVPATTTKALDFENAYHDFELETAGGVVLELLYGSVELVKEVSR